MMNAILDFLGTVIYFILNGDIKVKSGGTE